MNTNDMLARVAHLSDHDLLAQVKDLAQREREATVALVVHLAEIEERRLHLAAGYSSLFAYCRDVLHLSEHATCNRIAVARAARQFPVLLEHLAAGRVHLFGVRLLAPHLTPENLHQVLAQARHKSKREIEELVARLRPQPPVPDVIRKLPTRRQTAEDAPGPSHADTSEVTLALTAAVAPTSAHPPALSPAPPALPAQRAVVSPLAADLYRIQLTASAELLAKVEEARALLRHQIPDGDLEQVFDRALDALLTNLRRRIFAGTDRPREHRSADASAASGAPTSNSTSRHIPAAVRRAVWARDGGRCAFVSADGRRCAEEGFLEFHHVVPYAHGGPSTVDNVQLRCRTHNGYEAERHFGRWYRTAVREDWSVYAPSVLAVSAVATRGDRSINSFRNELDSGRTIYRLVQERLSESDCTTTGRRRMRKCRWRPREPSARPERTNAEFQRA